MSITKSRLSEDIIRKLCWNVFSDTEVIKITELTEGMCNVAYQIELADNTECILKVAPQNYEGLMSHEQKLMQAEVEAMHLVRESGAVKVAEIYAYDTTKELCSSEYFFMEMLEGKNYILCKEDFSEEERKVISAEMGEVQKRLTKIKGEKFGLLKYEECFDTLYEFIYFMLANVMDDAERKNVEIGITKKELLDKLREDKRIFDEVKEPTLVHWDMWEGNVFVQDKHIVGIIDWERALWGEAYMDERFRRHSIDESFMKGFGKTDFTEAEKKRNLWYDILLYLIMMTEVTYRQYENDWQYGWAAGMLKCSWQEIAE